MNKLIGMLGLCKNAGQLIMGFDPVADSIRARKAAVVLLASDISERTRKEVKFLLKDSDVPLCGIPLTLNELDFYVGRRAGVICTEDQNFAKALVKLSQNRA